VLVIVKKCILGAQEGFGLGYREHDTMYSIYFRPLHIMPTVIPQ
jgi:hypothetical protein